MGHPTVLVVDDDDDLRETMCAVLDDAGYATVAMPGGESAIEYLGRADPPDLIILDLMMPGIDGWRVREELRKLPRVADVPIVVATASRALARHPVDAAVILWKPFSARELLDAVARFSPTVSPADPALESAEVSRRALAPRPGEAILEARLDAAAVRRVYRAVAPVYDLWARLTESKARRRCLELARIRDGEAVLEVAVGTGLAFAAILAANPHGRNEGIDLTEEMLARAREKASRSGVASYRLAVGDARQLAYPDDSFDLLLTNYLFDLLPEEDFPAVLAEFRRVLRPGGRFVTANMTRAERWYQAAWETLYRVNPAWLGGCRGIRLQPALESAGFADVRRETVSQLGFPTEILYAVKPAAGV